jgi:cyclophilin family peptidyl-prolyl cis-trans isomerase
MNSRTTRAAYRNPFSLYFLLAMLFLPSPAAAVVNVRMQTDLGAIDIELFDTVAPQTVANFMNYVNDGDYEGTFFHRSIPGFIVQGGGFIANTPSGSILTDGASLIPTDPPVINEFNLSNVRGTIAMAKVDGDPDSATSQWFFNLDDNSANLDNQNGGFTVFAQVLNEGMNVVDSIAVLQRCIDIAFIPSLCGSFPDVPFTGADSDNFTNNGVINISYIGSDDEGDGAIDSLEDAAPNNGDGNNDNLLDSAQQFVASFPDESGGYTIIEVSPLTPIQSLNVLGITYARANPDTSGLLTDREFANGYFSFDILNVAPGDNVVTLTLPTGGIARSVF